MFKHNLGHDLWNTFFGLTPTQVVFDVTDRKNPASGEDGTYLVDWFDRDEKDRGLERERERAATFLNSVVPLIAMWETT